MMGRSHYAFGALFTAAGAPAVSSALHLGLTPGELVAGVAIGTIAGVLPDIDHPDSLITKGLLPGRKTLGPISRSLGWFLSIPPRVVGAGARQVTNHRGGTHSVTFMLGWTLLAAPMYAAVIAAFAFVASIILSTLSTVVLHPLLHHTIGFNPGNVVHWLIHGVPVIMPLVMVSVFFGYLAHLTSDSFTKVPVPWLWPFTKRRFFLLPKPLRVTTDSFVENHFIRPVVLVLAVAVFVLNIGIPLVQGISGSKPSTSSAPATRPASPHPVIHR